MHRPPASAVLSALLAFGCWGVFPIYWKAVGHIGSDIVVAHRAVWTLATALPLLILQGGWRTWFWALLRPGVLRTHGLSAALLAVNWGTFVWATQHGRIIESSLGYFLNPLFNVLIGCLVLGEKLSRWQKLSILLAGIGVAIQMVVVGRPPWIALTLAVSFGLYGLVRRRSSQGPLEGLATESLVALPFALGFLLWWGAHGQPVFGHATLRDVSLILGLGLISTIPLLGFAHAARNLPFSLLGLLQFLAPTGQFLLGVFLYGEPLTPGAIVAFAFIWTAITVFCVDLFGRSRAHAAR